MLKQDDIHFEFLLSLILNKLDLLNTEHLDTRPVQ